MNFNYDEEDKKNDGLPVPLETELDQPSATMTTGAQKQGSTVSAVSQLSLPKKKSSIMGASSNLVNSIVGAGIIGIPYALRMSGLWAGLLLLIMVAILTDKSLRILIDQASFHRRLHKLPIHTFEDLASYPFGRVGSGFVLFNMFIMAYGAMVAYLLIIKDTLPTVLGYDHGTHLLERNLILIVTSLGIMVPLSMQRDMASLSCTSAISVIADVILVIFIAAFAPIKENVQSNGGIGQILKNDGINSTLFIGLGILSTAMACQHSAFIVANSLDKKTQTRWKWVTNQSIALAAFLCAILGVCGYLGFMEQTQGDVLNNFPLSSMEADAARILLAMTMFFTYPMESFVARHVLIMLVHNGDMDGRGGCTPENERRVEAQELGDEDENDADDNATVNTTGSTIIEGGGFWCLNRRQTWTISVYLLSLIPALMVSDIGPVLSLTGAIGGSCISYIGPGLLFLGVNGEDFLTIIGDWVDHWRRAKGYSTTSSGNAANINNDGVTADDLPVDGDANLELPQDSNKFIHSYERIVSGPKPCWYYIAFFPLWCSIANKGATHMNKKIDAVNNAASVTSGSNEDETAALLLPPPTKWDFSVSIFFVLFGLVSLTAGVVTNVYVQWNGLDEINEF